MEMSIANQKDIETIIKLRKEQLLDQGMPATENIDDNMRAYFENVFEQNNIYQIFLIENEQIVSTGAVVFQQIPPAYDNYTGVEGYITNVYTIKSYRGLGLGKHVLDQLLTKCKEENISVVNLKASSQAAPLYSKIGFIKNASSMTIELENSEVNQF
ncbi:GNAT family N-acetyltransferase [Staphylococcus nepalensis]|uniref:GNAT family N-acetyltransferase n=1 Tax=Staphylococcus nepalensis TaxID=214473 RepID=UPI002271BB60|nr:GNAT family N-acetyltransferase [Staphylococcus nepalensis]MCY1038113.1 GNAT family N-acetyltransferase [Staphylococcus nepalensis]